MRRSLCCRVFISVLYIYTVDSQYSSPCPNLFTYQSDGNGLYGVIHLEHTGGPVSTLQIRANFTIAARLLSTYIGRIETIGQGQLLQNFNRGVPLDYRVNFPVTSPLPRLTGIVVNGELLCYAPGDVPAPNQYVTTISLDHMLFLKPGSSPGYFNHNEPAPNPDPTDYFGPYGDNTLTTINLDNKGSWTSVYYPSNNHNSNNKPQVPSFEPPVPVRPFEESATNPNRLPSRPKPVKPEVYYPDPTTIATKPTQMSSMPPPTQPSPTLPSRHPDVLGPIECGVISGGNERIPLIYQGQNYPRGDLPWLVAVYKRQEGSLTFICSGTLVSDRHVVTAAHCMHHRSRIYTIKDMVVKIGVYNLEDWGDDISVTRTLQAAEIHKSYNASTLENDILVFTMDRTVEFNTYIRPACLWNGNTDQSRIVGASGVVAGWGASEVGPVGQGEPRLVRIPIVSTAQCRASKPDFHKLTSARTLCAGDRNGSGPCLGDSGGGLYILENGRWRIRGVVSLSLRPQNGDNTCNLNEYIVFTDTAQYLGWIREILSRNYFDT